MLATLVNAAGEQSVSTVLLFITTFIMISTVVRKFLHDKAAFGKVPDGLARPPCLPWLPIIGSAPFIVKKLEDLSGSKMMKAMPASFLEKSKELGDVFAFYSMSTYTVVLNGRKAIHEAFVKKAVDFADRKAMHGESAVTNPTRNGIVSCPYNDGIIKRRSTTLSLLRDLGYGKRAMETRIQQQMYQYVEIASKFNGKPFDPAWTTFQCVAGVILGIVFGRHFEPSDPLIDGFHVFGDGMVALMAPMFEMIPPLRLLPHYRQLCRDLSGFSDNVFRLMKEEVRSCLLEKREDSMAWKYAEKEGPESVYSEDFLYIVRDMLLGGSETSQSTLRWMWSLLADHPNWQNRLHEEVDNHYGSSQRLPSLEDMNKLPLVNATILETLRIQTLIPLALPHQTLCDTEVNGYFIPKGTMVYANLWSAHMDKDEWENPTEFNPERFLNPDGEICGKERVISFSMGKRVCIGEQLARAELFIFLTGLMRHFHMAPPEGQSSVAVEPICATTIQPAKYNLRMIRRHDSNDATA